MFNKKEIMRTAWTLAKQWAFRKGGKAVEYIGAALKQAWKVAKMSYNSINGLGGIEANQMTLTGSKRQPMYLAVVKGLHDRFGLNREFVDAPYRGTVNHTFELNEGTIYNWSETKGVQFYGIFVNGKMKPLSKEETMAIFA